MNSRLSPSRAQTRRVSDLEEVLADPAIEAVIVAGAPAVRPAQLRRALQSERHVLCVHPADDSPEYGLYPRNSPPARPNVPGELNDGARPADGIPP